MRKRLTRKNFEEWLKAQPLDEPVGSTKLGESCPIAHFFHANGYPFAHVGATYWERDASAEKETELPLWACYFINFIGDMKDERITANEALRVLQEET